MSCHSFMTFSFRRQGVRVEDHYVLQFIWRDLTSLATASLVLTWTLQSHGTNPFSTTVWWEHSKCSYYTILGLRQWFVMVHPATYPCWRSSLNIKVHNFPLEARDDMAKFLPRMRFINPYDPYRDDSEVFMIVFPNLIRYQCMRKMQILLFGNSIPIYFICL